MNLSHYKKKIFFFFLFFQLHYSLVKPEQPDWCDVRQRLEMETKFATLRFTIRVKIVLSLIHKC